MINSLLGQKILEEDILVKTAKVTIINHHTQFWLMKDGKHLFLEKYADVSNYLTRLGYLASINEEQGHIIHATVNNPILDNLILVDTPGLFGKFSNHDKITVHHRKLGLTYKSCLKREADSSGKSASLKTPQS
ncbi:hypothetical protein A6K76_06265 [Caryophanon latum]|uniref:Dynamin N-terminal domain-containing protein n=1 Tax=Caryophanon latum TaxID=33977 RepID=A0A1C0YZG7_9BACL|nr:hypothetical protein A6K76_06265 [Caryophanon latum]